MAEHPSYGDIHITEETDRHDLRVKVFLFIYALGT